MKSGISQISNMKSGCKLRSELRSGPEGVGGWMKEGEGGEGSQPRQEFSGLGNDAMQSQSL
jgi:hypothetical protein